MRAQIFVDLAGAFVVLMLVVAGGFWALEKAGKEGADVSAACTQKNLLHSYADWLVKEGGSVSVRNNDGSGYYLHHEADLEKMRSMGGGFEVFVDYDLIGAGGAQSASGEFGGNKYCVRRVALCNNEICGVRACLHDGV